MKVKILVLALLSVSFFIQLRGQDTSTSSVETRNKLDSLWTAFNQAKHDTTRIKTYLKIGDVFKYVKPDTALFYYQKALTVAQNKKEQKFIAQCFNYIGLFYYYQSNYPKALEYNQKALKIFEELGNKKKISNNLGNIGVIYYCQSNYPKALEYYQKALKNNEELNNKRNIESNLLNIGNVYFDQSNYLKALEYYQKALKISEKLGNKKKIANNLGSIGNVYYYQNNYSKAMEYYQKSLKIFETIGYEIGIARNLVSISNVYCEQSNYPKAIEYNQKALKINERLGNKVGIAIDLGNIGNVYYEQNNYLKAIEYSNKSLAISKEIGSLSWEKDAYSVLSSAYIGLNKYKKALEYKDKWIEVNDSIFNKEKTKALAEMSAKYEAEKKQLQIDNLNKENALKKAELAQSEAKRNKQLILIWSFVAGFIIILVFSVVILRLFMQKKKANIVLAKQKQQIEIQNSKLNQANEEITAQRDEITAQRDMVTEQKEHIEEIHHEISQSIDYATRLQQSILPNKKLLEKHLSAHFVLFKPKDKVSGDFYWWSHIENHTVITAADCTGHGVPGAFMSMLGSSFLREIVQKEYITHTGVILRKLRKEIINSLKQKGEPGEQKDGMDMAIISIDHETNIVQFSGANNSLYIITSNARNLTGFENLLGLDGFYEIKPDKMPIAIYERMDNFQTYEIQLEKGDQLFMFSDGYADQFGGLKGKKFKYKPFKRLLSENRDKPMKEQYEILDKTLYDWMNNYGEQYEQIDDITVLGIKI